MPYFVIIFVLFFQDLASVIRKTALFFDKTFSDEQVTKLADHLSVSNMKDNDAVNFKSVVDVFQGLLRKETKSEIEFIRNGQTGEHKQKMSPEMMMKFDEWNARMKQELGISNDFPY